MKLSDDQVAKLKDMMNRDLRRTDFRHVTGFAFHTSWDRSIGRPRKKSTKQECIDAIVNALVDRSVVPSSLMINWLNGRIPAWRRDLGIIEDKETHDHGQGKQAPGGTFPGSA